MYNPTRRNRNIGTSNQGFSPDNKMTIPEMNVTELCYYERLGKYMKYKRVIHGHEFIFVVEETRKSSEHACSVNDIERIIGHIPVVDYGDLDLIVLRQPTRKEEMLSRVWGRLIYSYKFEGDYHVAILLEAVDTSKTMKWKKQLPLEEQHEFERLKEDGHVFCEGKRYFEAPLNMEHIRNTQLYRTLPHEFGHYVHYLNYVERPQSGENEEKAEEQRYEDYFNLLSREKEQYANAYAERLRKQWQIGGVIPFDPL